MTVSKVGLVFYQDTVVPPATLGAVFRLVYPTSDDSELDDPEWTTMGCDPSRTAVLVKVPQSAIPAFTMGTP